MASSSSPMTEELQCSICLDVFTDPVSTPCGHNFCKTCLNKFWNNTQTCNCPYCKETFKQRPDLKINTTLREIVDHYKKKNPEEKPEVLCDICEERKLKAQKSCLVCQSSYCETHLEPHLRVAGLKKHKLIEPVRNLEDYICQKHERPLEMFCRDDQTCVCLMCSVTDHKNHSTVPLEEEIKEKKTCLMKTQKDVQQLILKKIKMIQDTKHSAEIRKRFYNELLEMMEEQQKAAERQEWKCIKDLEQEITELKMRNTELEQLSHTEDHLHLLQVSSSQCSSTNTSNLAESVVFIPESLSLAIMDLCLLNDTLKEKSIHAELKWMQCFAVNTTLDPDTVHAYHIQFDDGKQARDTWEKLSMETTVKRDNIKRYERYLHVLAKEGFSSGRFYFEVEVKGMTGWILGVVRESIDRKENITLCPKNGYWTVGLSNGNEYIAYSDLCLCLHMDRVKLQRVGVFVDYEEGLVSFYDVKSGTRFFFYAHQSFTEKLYPYMPMPTQ